jgi:hypothetical protein
VPNCDADKKLNKFSCLLTKQFFGDGSMNAEVRKISKLFSQNFNTGTYISGIWPERKFMFGLKRIIESKSR